MTVDEARAAAEAARMDCEAARMRAERARAECELARCRYAIPAVQTTWRMATAMLAVPAAGIGGWYIHLPQWLCVAAMVAMGVVYVGYEAMDLARRLR